jgi:hypothetical protein
MDHIENLENLIFQWMMTLPEEEQKNLWDGYDVMNSMPEDAQEEVKNEIFSQMINEVNYVRLIKRLKEYLNERIVETDSDGEEEIVDSEELDSE